MQSLKKKEEIIMEKDLMVKADVSKELKEKEDVWGDLHTIKMLYAPNLTDREFQMFVGLGKALGANPFLREIWAIKYNKDQSAQIFLGRDFYRKKAQELPEYDGHIADAVYEKDLFEVENGIPRHRYSNGDRGRLIGAYCIVYKKNIRIPFFRFVRIEEYSTNVSSWKKMPETMIVKVAEAQGLRGAFQSIFRGTYSEAENWIDRDIVEADVVIDSSSVNSYTENSQSLQTTETTQNTNNEGSSNNFEVVSNVSNSSDSLDVSSQPLIKILNGLGIKYEINDKNYCVVESKQGYAHKSFLQNAGFKYHAGRKIYYKYIGGGLDNSHDGKEVA